MSHFLQSASLIHVGVFQLMPFWSIYFNQTEDTGYMQLWRGGKQTFWHVL